MKRTALVLSATFLVVAACSELTAPTPSQYLLLSGVWASSTATPGGSAIKIATYAAGGQITGIGVAYDLATTDSLKIGGQYSIANGTFGMSIAYASGRSATFVGPAQGASSVVGAVQGTSSLTGSWTDWSTGYSYEVTFTRLPVPPCEDSVPLLGSPDPAAPGFIVRFQDTVNATTETARLGAFYGFTATHVYVAAIRGFAAEIPLATVTVLRCEPKVVSIAYDASVTIAGSTPRP